MMTEPSDQNMPWYAKTYDTDNLFKKILPSGDLLTRSYDPETFFKQMLKDIVNKPLWVKQAIYIELRDDIKHMSNLELLEALDKNDLLQLYTPRLSIIGHKIINEETFATKDNVSSEMLNFLQQLDGRKNVIDLCFLNNWTLKHFSEIIIQANDKGYIDPIKSKQILTLFEFIADHIDMATLFEKLNKITPEQVQFARFSISEMNKTFEVEGSSSLEEVLVRMNYISKEQVNSLLILKQASEKVFEHPATGMSMELEALQENLEFLTNEKERIEEQIKTFKPLLVAKDKQIKALEEELNKYKSLYEKEKQSNNFLKKL
jgi:hypothetical protein